MSSKIELRMLVGNKHLDFNIMSREQVHAAPAFKQGVVSSENVVPQVRMHLFLCQSGKRLALGKR